MLIQCSYNIAGFFLLCFCNRVKIYIIKHPRPELRYIKPAFFRHGNFFFIHRACYYICNHFSEPCRLVRSIVLCTISRQVAFGNYSGADRIFYIMVYIRNFIGILNNLRLRRFRFIAPRMGQNSVYGFTA